MVQNFKNVLVTALHAEKEGGALLAGMFHMVFPVGTLGIMPGGSCLVYALGRGLFDKMMFAL